MEEYIILMSEICLQCRQGEQICTEMECKAVHDVMEAFFPYVDKTLLN